MDQSTTLAPAAPAAANLGPAVQAFYKLREQINAMDAAHEAAVAPHKANLQKLGDYLLSALSAAGLDNTRVGDITGYRQRKSSITVADPAAFMSFVVENQRYDLLDARAAKKACIEYTDQTGFLVPGTNRRDVFVFGAQRNG